jgi:hypothetical protein
VAANETDVNGNPFRLFSTSSDFEPTIGFNVRLSARLIGKFRVEGTFSYSRPTLATTTSSDVEGAASTNSTERVRQFQIEGGLLIPLVGGPDSRAFPFASVSAGYLRQLHEGETLAETGASGALGAGFYYFLTRSTSARAAGLRGEIKAVTHSPHLSFDDKLHVAPSLAGSVFVRF